MSRYRTGDTALGKKWTVWNSGTRRPQHRQCSARRGHHFHSDYTTPTSVSTASRGHRTRWPPLPVPAPTQPGSVPVRPVSRPAARRGNLTEALRGAGPDEVREAALSNLDRDRYAETSTRSRAAWLQSWVRMRHAAFQRVPNPLAPRVAGTVAPVELGQRAPSPCSG